jgi:rhodanese-related sulfurtransferase
LQAFVRQENRPEAEHSTIHYITGSGGTGTVTRDSRYCAVDGEELYRKLVMGEPVVVLDVRTETEHAARHIPGSLLIPLHELQSRVGEIPNSGTPVAVLSEKGLRAESACKLLAEHAITPLLNLAGGLQCWTGPTANGHANHSRHWFGIGPCDFLVQHFDLLPRGIALDLAMGDGRNAIYLATRGFDVDGVDVSQDAVNSARASARQLGAPIRALVGNVEDGSYIIPEEAYDVIMVFNFLHRPLFKEIKDGVKPDGVVIYNTFTVDQPKFGPPTNPDYLLKHGELKELFTDWEILIYEESENPERPGLRPRARAGIVARKPE